MKRNEFLDKLRIELKKNNVSDMEEIVSEYEQHFAFKLADGHTEEEIAAKLGAPEKIAAQFDSEKGSDTTSSSGKFLLKTGLFFAAIFETMFYILFLAWDIVLCAAALAFGAVGACLICDFDFGSVIPYIPYRGAFILGVSLMGLAVLFAVATFYCFEFLRQMIRASIRWHKNTLAPDTLPPLPWNPQFEPKTKRKLRTVLLWALAIFGVCFVLAFIVLMLAAGTMGFWHEWNWFVNI